MQFVTDPVVLESLYARPDAKDPRPARTSLDDQDQAFLRRATLAVVATIDNGGLTCSPRGGPPGSLVMAADASTVWLADAAAGRVHQTVRNLMLDPRIGLLLMAADDHRTLRLQGTARVTADPDALAAFSPHAVRTVIVIDLHDVRLSGRGPLHRSGLWDETPLVEPLP